jgi:hypothetical protein
VTGDDTFAFCERRWSANRSVALEYTIAAFSRADGFATRRGQQGLNDEGIMIPAVPILHHLDFVVENEKNSSESCGLGTQ